MNRILIIVVFFIGIDVMAWGPTGHRVVGKVAEIHASKKALKNVKRVLGSESLAIVSNWMDDIKSDDAYNHMNDWHWVTVPDGTNYASAKKNRNGDIIMTLNRAINELKEGNLPIDKEQENLKILIHLIGDLHQPLHVGTGKDAGGNAVKVKWFGRNSNLHRIYDSDVIESFQLSYTELAEVVNHPSESEINEWQSGTVEDWAHEAMKYRTLVYDLPKDMSLGYEFRYLNKKMIERQLLKAGIRLAWLLNEIYR